MAVTAGDEPAQGQDDEAAEQDQGGSDGQEESTATQKGRKRRRDLAHRVDDDVELSGQAELMVSGEDEGGFFHKVVLKGKELTTKGGPAREVFNLGLDTTASLHKLFPGINPQVALVKGGNSIEMKFYAPREEIEAARARRTAEEDIGAEGLPDTSLAMLVLAEVLSYQDPADAGEAAREVSVQAAERLRDLSSSLSKAGVALDMSDVAPGAKAQPTWSGELATYLQSTTKLDPEKVIVWGLLQGANSGGAGSFEIVTEATRTLDTRLGRRSAGSTIKGRLTARARKQIKDRNLWDTYVVARVEVSRVRKGSSTRQAGLRLMGVAPQPRSGKEEDIEGL